MNHIYNQINNKTDEIESMNRNLITTKIRSSANKPTIRSPEITYPCE